MYCPKCNASYEDGSFYCPLCEDDNGGPVRLMPSTFNSLSEKGASFMGEGNAVLGNISYSDSSVRNTSYTLVEAQKIKEQLIQENESNFLKEVQARLADGILSNIELAELEQIALKCHIETGRANEIISQVRRSAIILKGEHTNDFLINQSLQEIHNAELYNQKDFLVRYIPQLKQLTLTSSNENVHFYYYMLLASTAPESSILEFLSSCTDSYWQYFWVSVAYLKLGQHDRYASVVASLSGFVTQNGNVLLLKALDNLMEFRKTGKKEFYSAQANMFLQQARETGISIQLDALWYAVKELLKDKPAPELWFKFYVENTLSGLSPQIVPDLPPFPPQQVIDRRPLAVNVPPAMELPPPPLPQIEGKKMTEVNNDNSNNKTLNSSKLMGFWGFKSKKEVNDNNSYNSTKEQINFAIPQFEVFDPRMIDTGVPVAIHGTVTYSVEDTVAFKNLNPKEKYDDESFKLKLRSAVIKYVKGVVCTLPSDDHFPLVQLESKVVEISDAVYSMVAPQIEHSMGVKVVSFDITKIFIDKTSRGFRELKAITADFEKETLMAEQMAKLNELKLQQQMQYSQMEMQGKLNMDAMMRQHELNIGGQEKLQQIQLKHHEEMLRIQRNELLNSSNMGGNVKSTPSQISYMIGINGQQAGPFDWDQLHKLALQGQFTRETYVWTQGMQNWEFAGNVRELDSLFANIAPQINGIRKF